MNLRFSGVFADAGAMWHANREVLLTVAGVFVFLPVFAFNLFVMPPRIEGLEGDALMQAVANWYVQNGAWLALTLSVQAFGSATVLAMLLDPARPTVGQAISRVVGLLPALVVAMLGSAGLIFGGFLLFIFPAMYAFGRCYLLYAVIVAEPEHGTIDGFVEGLKRTHGLGWRLFALGMFVILPFYLVAQILGGLTTGLDDLGTIGIAVSALIAATLGTVLAIAQLLLQAAAYRATKPGI